MPATLPPPPLAASGTVGLRWRRTPAARLTDLSDDLLTSVLDYLSVADAARLSATCSRFRALIPPSLLFALAFVAAVNPATAPAGGAAAAAAAGAPPTTYIVRGAEVPIGDLPAEGAALIDLVMDTAYRHAGANEASVPVRAALGGPHGPPPLDLAAEWAALMGAPPPAEHPPAAPAGTGAGLDDPHGPCGAPLPGTLAVGYFRLPKTNARALWAGVPRVPVAGTHGTHHYSLRGVLRVAVGTHGGARAAAAAVAAATARWGHPADKLAETAEKMGASLASGAFFH